MQITIDRIEGIFAVVEISQGHTINLPLELFPKTIKEGDIIDITINKHMTEERKNTIENKFDFLTKK